ncbi:MAG: alpha/beta hydrolase [Gordonia polyisoprenivorans]|nr:alpha/beta hydrolase [Gordonia polyisoprenivorans]
MVGPRTLPWIRRLAALPGRRPGTDVEVHTLSSGAAVRLYRPSSTEEPTGALLWMHGGGHVLGSAGQDEELCRRLARDAGIVVASVDYRLSPEHPYPAALDDCAEAMRWLRTLRGVDPDRVAVGGASAGGGLAASLAHRLHDSGDVTPRLQLLVYPMLDHRTVAASPDIAPQLRLWDGRTNAFGWSAYLGSADVDDAVPARRADLRGLPPAWIGLCEFDLFMPEGREYADRLRRSDVRCDVRHVGGAFHGLRP